MLHTFDVYLFCVVADQSFTDESSRTGGSSNADDEDQYGDSSMCNYVYLSYLPIYRAPASISLLE